MKDTVPEKARESFRKGFVEAVGGCDIQNGWPCRTCFFFTIREMGIDGDEAHAMWLVQLLMREKNPADYNRRYTITTTATPEQAEHEERARRFREERDASR